MIVDEVGCVQRVVGVFDELYGVDGDGAGWVDPYELAQEAVVFWCQGGFA